MVKFLHIENVQANTKGNSIVGLGDIPIDLNFSSKSFGNFTWKVILLILRLKEI